MDLAVAGGGCANDRPPAGLPRGGEQKWPTKAWTKWAEANGTDPNHYSETDHAALFA